MMNIHAHPGVNLSVGHLVQEMMIEVIKQIGFCPQWLTGTSNTNTVSCGKY